jgi:hypothetical protein
VLSAKEFLDFTDVLPESEWKVYGILVSLKALCLTTASLSVFKASSL